MFKENIKAIADGVVLTSRSFGNKLKKHNKVVGK